MEPTSSGRVTVRVGACTLLRADGVPAPDALTRATVHWLASADAGGVASAWWWGADSPLSATAVLPGAAPNYAYRRDSRPVPLTARCVDAALARGVVVVALHAMAVGGGEPSALLAWASQPTSQLLGPAGVAGGLLTLQPASTYPAGWPGGGGGGADGVETTTGSVAVALAACPALCEFVAGGRLVTLTGVRLQPVPGAWLPASVPRLPDAGAEGRGEGEGEGEGECGGGGSGGGAAACSVPAAAPHDVAAAAQVDPWRYALWFGGQRRGGGAVDAAGAGGGEAVAGGGALRYVRVGAPAVASSEPPPHPPSPPPPPRVDAGEAPAPKGKAGPSAPSAKAAAAAEAAAAVAREATEAAARMRAAHAGWAWVVEWPAPHTLFLSRDAVARLAQGGATLGIRRVRTAAAAGANDPRGADAFGLPPGLLDVEEDVGSRGEAALPSLGAALSALGAITAAGSARLEAVEVSAGARDADAVARVVRDAAWEACASTGGAGTTGATSPGAAAASPAGGAAPPPPKPAAKQAAGAAAKPAAAPPPAPAAPGKPAAPAPPAPSPAKAAGGTAPGKSAAPRGAKPAALTATVPAGDAVVSAGDPPPPVLAAATVALALTMALDRPLRARPPSPPRARATVASLAPPRAASLAAPPRPDAVEAFRREVAAVAQRVHAVCATAPAAAPAGAQEEEPALHALRAGGEYGTLVQRLAGAAHRVARETALAVLPGAGAQPGSTSRHAADSRLYSFLCGQLGNALQRAAGAVAADTGPALLVSACAADARDDATAATRPPGGVAPAVPDSAAPRSPRWDALRLAALERELCCGDTGDGAAVLDAERLLRQRVRDAEAAAARGDTGGALDADVWHDLGAFLARRGHSAGAEECLREALRVQPAHGAALTACAALAVAGGRYGEACTLAAAAAALEGAPAVAASVAHSLLALAAHLSGDVMCAIQPAGGGGGGGGGGAEQEEGAGDSPCARVLRAGEDAADGVPAAQAARAALRLARYVLELGPAAGTLRDVAVERAAAACAVAPHAPATSHEMALLHARRTLLRAVAPAGGGETEEPQAVAHQDAARAALQRVAEEASETALRAEAWYALSRLPGGGGGGGSDARGVSEDALRWATAGGDDGVPGISGQDSTGVAALVWRTRAPVWPVAAALQLAGALLRDCEDAPDSGRAAAGGAARAAYLRAADAWAVAVGGSASSAPPCWTVLSGLARLAAADGDAAGAAELMGRASAVEPRALLREEA